MQQFVSFQQEIFSIMSDGMREPRARRTAGWARPGLRVEHRRVRLAMRFAPFSAAFLQFIAFRFPRKVLVSYFTTTPPHSINTGARDD
jgi:hypothetical protein